MRNLTCIVCPIGCSLTVNEDAGGNLSVTGNRCLRGELYAKEEVRAPKRTVTATCQIDGLIDKDEAFVKRVPVKTASPLPTREDSRFVGGYLYVKGRLACENRGCVD
ncbi:DUF1667 domain-containing protein [Treponema sp. R6D11]